MKVTLTQLEHLGACDNAILWFSDKNTNDVIELYELAVEEKHKAWAIWYGLRVLSKEKRLHLLEFIVNFISDKLGVTLQPERMRYIPHKCTGNQCETCFIIKISNNMFFVKDDPIVAIENIIYIASGMFYDDILLPVLEHMLKLYTKL